MVKHQDPLTETVGLYGKRRLLRGLHGVDGEKMRFSTEVAVCHGNGMR